MPVLLGSSARYVRWADDMGARPQAGSVWHRRRPTAAGLRATEEDGAEAGRRSRRHSRPSVGDTTSEVRPIRAQVVERNVWTRLTDDASHGGCASAGCFFPASWRLDVDDVGSQYCERCKDTIDPSRPDGDDLRARIAELEAIVRAERDMRTCEITTGPTVPPNSEPAPERCRDRPPDLPTNCGPSLCATA